MPIYIYICPEGHETEFLKLKAAEEEPEFCGHIVAREQHRSGAVESFPCGLPLEKQVAQSTWRWTRGKNPSWPLTEPVDPTPGPGESYN